MFVTPRERHLLGAIERATRQQITPMRLPTREDVADKRASQFKQRITEVIAGQDLVFFERLIAGYEEEHGTEPRAIAAALAYLAQKDRPLQPPPVERAAAPREDRRGSRDERRDRREIREPSGDKPPAVDPLSAFIVVDEFLACAQIVRTLPQLRLQLFDLIRTHRLHGF